MKQEDKHLLSVDLCARLPYNVKIQTWYGEIITSDLNTFPLSMEEMDKEDMWDQLSSFKPYLRPMSSMTEEEKKEISELLDASIEIDTDGNISYFSGSDFIPCSDYQIYIDYLISHHFDYRGLISKGLALEAPEGMYK